MKIGKKLYVGFGSVLVILVILFHREFLCGPARAFRASGRQDDPRTVVRTIEAVRLPDHVEPPEPDNYLLSGDPRGRGKS